MQVGVQGAPEGAWRNQTNMPAGTWPATCEQLYPTKHRLCPAAKDKPQLPAPAARLHFCLVNQPRDNLTADTDQRRRAPISHFSSFPFFFFPISHTNNNR